MATLLGFIPSPSSGVVHLGPLTIHLYGLTLLVAILLCVWLTTVRWRRQGGDSELVIRVAVWGVAFGVIGARAYHDLTSWNEVPTPKWQGVFEVWKGGLGIWGGILLGTLAGVIVVRRAGVSAAAFLDATAPGLLARAGDRPDRQLVEPGALRQADDASLGAEDRRGPPRRACPAVPRTRKAYQPTFLYELLWDLAGAALLLWLSRRRTLPAAGALRALRRLLLLRAVLRGAAPDRPLAPHPRPAAQRLGLGGRVRRSRAASSSGGRCSDAAVAAATGPPQARAAAAARSRTARKMAVPRGRVR